MFPRDGGEAGKVLTNVHMLLQESVQLAWGPPRGERSPEWQGDSLPSECPSGISSFSSCFLFLVCVDEEWIYKLRALGSQNPHPHRKCFRPPSPLGWSRGALQVGLELQVAPALLGPLQ